MAAEAPVLSKVTLEFSGGCELLVNKQSKIVVDSKIPTGTTLRQLVLWIRDHVLAERPDHFVNATGDGIRPGVLMLVNDCDSEVVGGHDYVVEEGDSVAFISTLHGG
uniref:Ubiquitin-related modifier 1 homolog n=1 Tax=Neobodo designis TaxID=312471 RepID=A0A7S1W667_NEODS